MKLSEALKILQSAPVEDAERFRSVLVCGFTPLHLHTFFAAHLQRAFPQYHIEVSTGLYGDLTGTLAQLFHRSVSSAAIVIEWPDLDPRLGWRQLGGWGPAELEDILKGVEARLKHISEQIEAAAGRGAVTVCFPTLPLPPLGGTALRQAGRFELELRERIAHCASTAAQNISLRVVDTQYLETMSPSGSRFDFKSELFTGFPYTLQHAAALGEIMAELTRPSQPKKGLITDLDDTLWSGLAGEVGPEEVSWDLERHTQLHGIYQQMLRALADRGVLVAVASKNDPAVVEQAFARRDMILSKDRIFPFEVHWHRKSQSITRILRAWNIAADSVVFVDDSPMELAEVAAAHPGIECLLFPNRDYGAAYRFFERLRDLFGKPVLSREDFLRVASVRAGGAFQTEARAEDSDPDAFLARAGAILELSFRKSPQETRALELINKTNQFNLNGVRLTESEWRRHLDSEDTFVLVADYRDKYGPLGKIAVVAGRVRGKRLEVSTWVMSCRAFARRIEHKCLELLFDRFAADEIVFHFQATLKNGPVREFLAAYVDELPCPKTTVSNERFLKKCPPLFHQVEKVHE